MTGLDAVVHSNILPIREQTAVSTSQNLRVLSNAEVKDSSSSRTRFTRTAEIYPNLPVEGEGSSPLVVGDLATLPTAQVAILLADIDRRDITSHRTFRSEGAVASRRTGHDAGLPRPRELTVHM
jgi:hypothetical protein